MYLKKSKLSNKFISIVLILGLIVTMNSFAFLSTNNTVRAETKNVTEREKSDSGISSAKSAQTQSAKIAKEATNELKTAADIKSTNNELVIKNVEVLSRGDFQSLYRDSVYKGKAENGEDPNKWYTSNREFNLKDPRVFNLEFKVEASKISTSAIGGDISTNKLNEYEDSINISYDGYDISQWGDGNTLRGDTDIFTLTKSGLTYNNNGTYTMSMSLKSDSPWLVGDYATANHIKSPNVNATAGSENYPYENYIGGDQRNFRPDGTPSSGRSQSGDNRGWWQFGPAYNGMGEYKLAAVKDNVAVAETDVHIGPYDNSKSWIEINEWAQSLIKGITGSEVSIEKLNTKPTGIIASGYVDLDSNGNFTSGREGTNVYVEVSILGYGLTDNYRDENKNFKNYSRFNPQWNVVVAKNKNQVDKYLKETVPTMNDNPQSLIDKYKDKNPNDIDMVNVVYQNNVHADEVTGCETMMDTIEEMIDGGSAGKKIKYKTFNDNDIDYRYRKAASGYQTSTSSHEVKGRYGAGSRFMNPTSRQDSTFDTGAALDEFIFVSTICSNPDGKAAMRRTNRYAFDNNRDAIFSTQPENISLTKDVIKWDPLLFNEWHGYVQQMLIEPCTAPHAPTYEYDLLQNNMLALSYSAGKAVSANTAYANFRIPWDHLSGGDWDDGGNIYSPMLSMLLGTYGYTVEFPHANSDSYDAGAVINYAMVNELMNGETKFYEGNLLNGELNDISGKKRDSHKVDNKYTGNGSMRKSSVMNKLEVKLRGVENQDSMSADKYFIDTRNNEEVVVGRPRTSGTDGKTNSFFPDYIVIPMDEDNQYNAAEGIKAINTMIDYGMTVKKSTEDITYEGKIIPKGAYIFDMKQGKRNMLFEIMGKGYDATGFGSMYADIYCNFPDVRGFDSVQIFNSGLFNGKTVDVSGLINKTADIAGKVDEYTIFKSQSTDAVRFVNLLLSGTSSGPSSAKKGDVWMLKKNIEGVGSASDYIIRTKDLSKINKLVDNPDLALRGCHIEGQYLNELPDDAFKLVEPVINLNTARGSQAGGIMWWMLDDFLGFGSMSPDSNYNGGSNLREGANVVLSNNAVPSESVMNAIKKNKLGLINIQNASSINNSNFGTGFENGTGSFSDVAVNGKYNIDESLYTANYKDTTTLYGRGRYYNTIPAGSKTLFKTLEKGEDAFIGGWQNTSGSKTDFGGKTLMFSTILTGGGIEGKPVQSVTFGQSMSTRSHYQKLMPVLATAIYAGAAGMLDDLNDPQMTLAIDGDDFKVTATEPKSNVIESGIDSISLYKWNGKKYIHLAEGDGVNELKFRDDLGTDKELKIVVTDYAANKVERNYSYSAADRKLTSYESDEAIIRFSDGTIKIVKIGSPIGTMPVLPAKEDMNFAGWYTDDTFKTQVKESTIVTGNMNLVAKFVSKYDLAGANVTKIKNYVYNGKAKLPNPTVSLNGIKLVKNKDYTLKYQNNKKVGLATVNIIAKDKYIGKKTVTFKINPKKTSIKKVKVSKKKAIVRWKKVSGTTKYQVRYKLSNGKKWKTKTVSSKASKSTISKLKKGKKYRFQVRSYKTVKKVKYYSAWSKIKTSKRIK